jgi:hypothetical protein
MSIRNTDFGPGHEASTVDCVLVVTTELQLSNTHSKSPTQMLVHEVLLLYQQHLLHDNYCCMFDLVLWLIKRQGSTTHVPDCAGRLRGQ